jgi:hypothetical protein
MNGKKAKALRRLAAVERHNQAYYEDQRTAKLKQHKNLAGEVVFAFKTATIKLKAGSRVMYKMLKKQFKLAKASSQ